MPKSCLDGYLTEECATCNYWRNELSCCGCGAPFPIMHCDAFAKMYEAEENMVNNPYFDLRRKSELPKAIYTVTKSGEIIIMEANNFTLYTKVYYHTSDLSATNHTNLRRVKHVNLPAYIDGTVYDTTNKLFMHLLNTGRYSLCGW